MCFGSVVIPSSDPRILFSLWYEGKTRVERSIAGQGEARKEPATSPALNRGTAADRHR